MKKEKELTTDDLKEVLKILKEPITVNSINLKYFTEDQYNMLVDIFEKCQRLFPRYDTMIEICKEHKILKQFIIDEGLYEKLINSDKFINWLNEDPELKEGENYEGEK